MTTIGVTQAKKQFYELYARAVSGEQSMITVYGKPAAILGPVWLGELKAGQTS